MIKTQLTDKEIFEAAIVGVMRQCNAIKNNRKAVNNQPLEKQWGNHIEGALAERAVAKHYNVYWTGSGVIGGPDVGEVEVRQTEYHSGSLLLQPNDKDNHFYFLATGQHGDYRIVGYILGKNGKAQRYWGDPKKTGRPCFWVPQHDLRQPPSKALFETIYQANGQAALDLNYE